MHLSNFQTGTATGAKHAASSISETDIFVYKFTESSQKMLQYLKNTLSMREVLMNLVNESIKLLKKPKEHVAGSSP